MHVLVRDVMTTRVHTLREDETFAEVVKTLVEYGISGAPVVDQRGKLVGILSEKDLLKRLFPNEVDFYQNLDYYLADYERIINEARRVLPLRAKDMMRTEVHTIAPDQHIMKACAKMAVHKIRRLPVMENQRLVGIVSTNDIYRKFLQLIV